MKIPLHTHFTRQYFFSIVNENDDSMTLHLLANKHKHFHSSIYTGEKCFNMKIRFYNNFWNVMWSSSKTNKIDVPMVYSLVIATITANIKSMKISPFQKKPSSVNRFVTRNKRKKRKKRPFTTSSKSC